MEQANEVEEDAEDEVAKILDVGELGLEEARYLLEKMLTMTVNQTCLATQKEGKIKELDNRMQQAMKQNSLHQQLLQHMIEQQDLEIYDLMLQNEDGEADDSDSDSEEVVSSRSVPPSAPSLGQDLMVKSLRVEEDAGTGSDSSLGRREKARRRNLNKEDLLFNDLDMPGLGNEMLMLPPKGMPPVPGSRLPRQVSNLSRPQGQTPSGVPFSRSLSFTRAPSNSMARSLSFVKNGAENMNLMTMSMDQATLSRLAPVYQPSPVLGRRSLDRQRWVPRTFSDGIVVNPNYGNPYMPD